ncbi:MAG: hypothetical protein R3F13_09720 [Prosthecobacter sp.]
MKTILFALVMLTCGFALAAPEQEFDVIHTLRGKSYQQCRIMQRDADGVAFSHRKGIARVLFSDLPESLRVELGYNAGAAADLQRKRDLARKEKAEQEQKQRERAAELRHETRLAEIKRLAQRPLVVMQSPSGAYFSGPVPAVGFAASGWGGGYFHPQHWPASRGGAWSNVGIATIGAGSGGIYVPQSGGFVFTGVPQVHYSPTLGYYNPGRYAPPAAPSLGTFGVVPGLAAPAPAPPAVVSGVGRSGGVSLGAPK